MTQRDADAWANRKRDELASLVSWLDDVARDRAEGRLSAEEITMLEQAAREMGRPLTDPEANMHLAQYRQFEGL